MFGKRTQEGKFLDRLQSQHPTLYFFLDLIVNVVVVIILVYGVRTFLISPFQVYGPSMCDTLNKLNAVCQDGFGEYLIVNKSVYYPFFGSRYRMPERGDIIVFRPPHNPADFYIKRVIGLPGERVKIQNGKVYIYNKDHQAGWGLPEPYLNEENLNHTYATPSPSPATVQYEVPEDHFFVLGDNRLKSTDSRTCFRGIGDPDCRASKNHFLPVENIEGKAWVVLWPFNKIRWLEEPPYVSSAR